MPQKPSYSSFSPLTWFAANPVASNLLMLLIWLGGTFSILNLQKDVFPRFTPRQFEIEAIYPGAGPVEVETAVCSPIEEALQDISGIERLTTTVFEGECQIKVAVLQGYDRQALMSSARGRIQTLPQLPRALERIDVKESGRESEDGVIWVALYGPVDPLALKRFGERIQSDLSAIPGVTRTVDYGRMRYEIAIQLHALALLRHHLTIEEVADAVRRSSLDLAGGVVKTPAGELLLRVKGRSEQGQSIGQLVLIQRPDGARVRLADVATVTDGLDERWFQWRHDGYPAQGWEIHAERDGIEVARRVKAYVAETAKELPAGLRLKTWWDDSQAFEERITTLLEDGLSGFALVCLVLSLFLSARIAFWAGMGILTSVLGALWWMPMLDVSLNMLSLFGFLLAMGILVDDAIIIGEAVHKEQCRDRAGGLRGHGASLSAVIRGARGVALPVVLSIVIVLVAFLPGLFLPGWSGAMMRPICLVMILTLLFSLIEALLILPAHLAGAANDPIPSGPLARLRAALNRRLERFVADIYGPLLRKALAWRYLTLALFCALLFLTAGLVMGDHVRLSLAPDVSKDAFWVRLTVPPGAPPDEIRRAAERVEQALFRYRDELEGKSSPARRQGSTNVSSELVSKLLIGQETMIWEQEAGLWLELSPEARLRIRVEDFVREWRRRVGDIGRARIDFLYREGDAPYDIMLNLSASDPELSGRAAKELKRKLSSYQGVFDVMDSAIPGKPELRLTLKPEAEHLGLNLRDLAEQVRRAYVGEEAQRLQRGRQELKVMVRYAPEQRRSLDDLYAMPVRLPDGSQTILSTLAEVAFAPGYAQLTRQDRRRVLEVVARVDPAVADVNAIHHDLEHTVLPQLRQRFPGIRTEVGQERKDQEALLSALAQNTLVALAIIYTIIAVTFRSYVQPLIFLFAVPVAWSGGVMAHWLLGLPLSMESIVGMIAAGGVVVNDSLVLLDSITEPNAPGTGAVGGKMETDTHKPADHAAIPGHSLVLQACTARFRPILLAFLTNFAGFLPTVLETSAQARFLVPMTLSLATGLLFGMGASLLLTPACFTIAQDLRNRNVGTPAERA